MPQVVRFMHERGSHEPSDKTIIGVTERMREEILVRGIREFFAEEFGLVPTLKEIKDPAKIPPNSVSSTHMELNPGLAPVLVPELGNKLVKLWEDADITLRHTVGTTVAIAE